MLVYMTSMVRVRAWKVHGWASPQLGKGQIPGGALRCPPGVRCRLLGNGKVHGDSHDDVFDEDDVD